MRGQENLAEIDRTMFKYDLFTRIQLNYFSLGRGAAAPLLHVIRRIGNQKSDPETAAHSLLLVPLWHLLSGTLKQPFAMNNYDKVRHNSIDPFWWGLSEWEIRDFIDELKPIIPEENRYRNYILYSIVNLFTIYILYTCL